MELGYTYLKIRQIAKEVKSIIAKKEKDLPDNKKTIIKSLVEVVPFVFTDEDVLDVFIRDGAGCKDNNSAAELINQTMIDGEDYFDIQISVIKALIAANFYKKELQEMLKTLEVQNTTEQN